MSLFDPIELRGLQVRNRIWLPPMCQYCAGESGEWLGRPNDWHYQHYASRSVGGFGLITVEATAVTPVGRISNKCLCLDDEADVPAFRHIARVIAQHGGVAAIQLNHAGRKASTRGGLGGGALPPEEAWETVGPSAIAFEGLPAPREMTEAEIQAVIAQFACSANLAVESGFQAIEIHAAHGYLIHQFLSPISNHREDAWGGDFEGRTRLLREVVRAVRAVIGDVPLFVRISATDWLAENFEEVDGSYGWTLQDSIRLVRELPDVDFWSVSTGGCFPVKIPAGPGYQVPFARRIREETGAVVGAAGQITNATQADVVVYEEEADVVYVGRVGLHDPYVPRHWAKVLDVEIPWPDQLVRGRSTR
ncbi:NADH:flavin oxidoreductase/NADH oxidase [Trueperella bernardiae]|uniref:NADH:flavin oxidoreductase/NADH oxidase n=1 Tax=Trueperella bernardiae TaxID=59561 RepID=UPI002948DE25|nr:NADH:flavin oxidoreductase/NADH oxidase [Trueperella bernardiae]MDV6238247.1 NADH:flavin oxidoreductase/NADH oxidase [Trueperella bernardiae]